MSIAEVSRRMLDAYPRAITIDRDLLVECIAACSDCAQACTHCADACLSEPDVASLVRCIRTDLDCADVCAATGRVISRQAERDAGISRALLEACMTACRACGEECESHAQHGMEHCAVCAERCRRCEEACGRLAGAMS